MKSKSNEIAIVIEDFRETAIYMGSIYSSGENYVLQRQVEDWIEEKIKKGELKLLSSLAMGK